MYNLPNDEFRGSIKTGKMSFYQVAMYPTQMSVSEKQMLFAIIQNIP